MVFDVPTMVNSLKNRCGQDNMLTNIDSEYVTDIDEVLTLYINSDLLLTCLMSGVTYSGATPPAVLTGNFYMDAINTVIDPVVYGAILVRTELHIIDRKLEFEIPLAVSAMTPAGRIRGRDVPELRYSTRRKELMESYEQRKEDWLNGVGTGRSFGINMQDILLYRDVPLDKFSPFG